MSPTLEESAASLSVRDIDVHGVGQLGTTIGLGLLVDTFIVRSFMTPPIAAALGRWFWWLLNTFRITRKDVPAPEQEGVCSRDMLNHIAGNR